MKKMLLSLALFALAALSFANLTSADEKTRKELEAVYAKIDAAIKAKDVKTLESLLAEDYEKRVGDQTETREQVVTKMRENMKMIKSVVAIKTTINKIQHVEGNEIVDYTQTGKAVVADADGKDQTVDVTTKGRDWWVKDDDGNWICVAAERMD